MLFLGKTKIVVTDGVVVNLSHGKHCDIPKTINITGRLDFGSVFT